MSMTLEQKLRICHEVNTAIARGYTVKIGSTILENGLFVRNNHIVTSIPLHDKPQHCIVVPISTTKRIVIEDESFVIYDPNSADNLDLSNSSPCSVANFVNTLTKTLKDICPAASLAAFQTAGERESSRKSCPFHVNRSMYQPSEECEALSKPCSFATSTCSRKTEESRE